MHILSPETDNHLRCQTGTNLAVLNLLVLPTKFQLNLTYRSGADVVSRFQNGHHGGHLRYWNGTNLNINLQVTPMPLTSLGSIRNTIQEQTWFEDFQDGHCGGYGNGMILAILNLYVAPMPPIKFQLNPIYSLGDVI